MALPQPWSVLMAMVPVTAEGREDRAAQSWPLPSLAATLRKLDFSPHRPQIKTEQVLNLSWTAGQRANPAGQYEDHMTMKVRESSVGSVPLVCHVVAWVSKNAHLPCPSPVSAGRRTDPSLH